MIKIRLRINEPEDKKNEESLINMIRPDFNLICSSKMRVAILHLLIKANESNHSMRVEDIAHKLGRRHSVIIYHLEQLKRWKLVEVIKTSNYGKKQRRTIWGLNLKYPNLIKAVYSYTLKFFFSKKELEKLCNVNSNPRVRDK